MPTQGSEDRIIAAIEDMKSSMVERFDRYEIEQNRMASRVSAIDAWRLGGERPEKGAEMRIKAVEELEKKRNKVVGTVIAGALTSIGAAIGALIFGAHSK